MHEDEYYTLTMWGCPSAVLEEYGFDTNHISGRVGEHIVEDYMDQLEQCGYLKKKEQDEI